MCHGTYMSAGTAVARAHIEGDFATIAGLAVAIAKPDSARGHRTHASRATSRSARNRTGAHTSPAVSGIDDCVDTFGSAAHCSSRADAPASTAILRVVGELCLAPVRWPSVTIDPPVLASSHLTGCADARSTRVGKVADCATRSAVPRVGRDVYARRTTIDQRGRTDAHAALAGRARRAWVEATATVPDVVRRVDAPTPARDARERTLIHATALHAHLAVGARTIARAATRRVDASGHATTAAPSRVHVADARAVHAAPVLAAVRAARTAIQVVGGEADTRPATQCGAEPTNAADV